MYTQKVGRSKTGLPTITENGGGATNSGSCQIVCGANGEKVQPLFVPRGTCNGDHAIFVAKVGMHIVSQYHSRDGETVEIRRIDKIGTQNDPDELDLVLVGDWENGDGKFDECFQSSVNAAMQKGHCYHCRESHFSIQ